MIGLYEANSKTSIMKNRKLLFGILFIGLFASSCYTEVIVEDDLITEPPINTALVLESHDLWYVDINKTLGSGEVPFLQRAFTITFDRGIVYANNNLSGLGKTGNGLGIDVGAYATYSGQVEIDHDVDGLWLLEVIALDYNTLEIYDPRSDTSYILEGYQRSNFDYDMVFYDNIHLFLQEYQVWEKTYTSELGALNEFDEENYLQFFPDGGGYFRSSIDNQGIPLNNIKWDYQGDYEVYDRQ